MSRIFIIGAGVVGLATGQALRSAGHQVTFVDTDQDRVTDLCTRGLDARAELRLTGEPESYLVLTLPTRPSGTTRAGSPGYDLDALREGVRAVARALAGADSRHIVVVRSTVPPGTTNGMVRHLLERGSGTRAGLGFDLVCQPEFLRPGHADHDTQWPTITVIGCRDLRIADRVARDLAPFGGVQHRVGTAEAAEMIKCAHLAQRTVNAALWDEIGQVCDRWEIDVRPVAHALAQDSQLVEWAPGLFPAATSAAGSGTAGRPDPGDDPHEDAERFLALAAASGIGTPVLAAALAAATTRRPVPAELVPRQDIPVAIRLDSRAEDRAGSRAEDRAGVVPNGRV